MHSINESPALRDWATRQPEGLSALVRRLLAAEQQRRTRQRQEAPR